MAEGIVAEGLTKVYRVKVRESGLAGAVRALVRPRYRDVAAVTDVSFTIARGEIVAFLGPNGAGKTTTLKMLAGLLFPSAGRARVAGYEPWSAGAAFKRRIALILGNKQQLLWDLPAEESFQLNRAIYAVPPAAFRERLDELVTLLGLGELVDKPVRQLSLGERMKCELAAALLHRPEILFLDEPTLGLDVEAQEAIRAFLRTYRERHGATILLTSHYMADVLALAPRVLIINRGRLLYDGELRALVARIDSCASTSSPSVGSSRNRISGRCRSAAASSHFMRSPSDSCRTGLSSSSPRPRSVTSSSRRSRKAGRGMA